MKNPIFPSAGCRLSASWYRVIIPEGRWFGLTREYLFSPPLGNTRVTNSAHSTTLNRAHAFRFMINNYRNALIINVGRFESFTLRVRKPPIPRQMTQYDCRTKCSTTRYLPTDDAPNSKVAIVIIYRMTKIQKKKSTVYSYLDVYTKLK